MNKRNQALIQWDDSQFFHELNEWKDDLKLKELIESCTQLQKQTAASYYENHYKPSSHATEEVSPEKLKTILEGKKDIHGIATQREISNVIVFNAEHIGDAIMSQELVSLRKQIDHIITQKLEDLFDSKNKFVVTSSGHFWYPPQSFMGWHTNSKAPGWRLYINYAKDPHKSFFRYRDPHSKEIITCHDEVLNFRLFRIDPSIPLWHSVYSDTDRFSIGYMSRKASDVNPSFLTKLYRKLFK